MVRLSLIVEGHGDVQAVPILIRRMAAEIAPELGLELERPIRIGRHRLVRPGELERAAELAARRAGRRGGILVVVDADDSCPGELGPELLRRVRATRGDLPAFVVLAKKEFEAWFLAAARSLRGVRSLPRDLEPPKGPEEIRAAKEWLSTRMEGSRSYRETRDQAPLAARMDLVAARGAPSFDKCWRDLEALLRQVRGTPEVASGEATALPGDGGAGNRSQERG